MLSKLNLSCSLSVCLLLFSLDLASGCMDLELSSFDIGTGGRMGGLPIRLTLFCGPILPRRFSEDMCKAISQ